MNSINSRSLSGRCLGLFLSLVLAGSAYAGPSTQRADQMQRQREAGTVQAPMAAVVAPAMACSQCQTRVIEEYSATNSSGKWAPHASVVGRAHECTSCGGAITTIRGQTTNAMAGNCTICAHAQAACCTTNS